MPHRVLNVPEFGMRDAYLALLAARGFQADPAQQAAAGRLQRLYGELLAFKVARRGVIRRIFFRHELPQGVYFWGGVGRGKSFLMDCFFDAVPYRRKQRIHFHAFMRDVHRQLNERKGESDPLLKVADAIAEQVRLLCFDEFHVSDIADAMILGRLLQALFERGVVFVMTSNYPPELLYPNGLQRESFLPTIALLKRQLDVVRLDGGIDYRLRTLEHVDIFHTPDDDVAERKLNDTFDAIAGGHSEAHSTIALLGRTVPVRRSSHGVIWFDFATLCGGPRSQNDYLELAQAHHTLLLSGIPRMSVSMSSEARRFTWLIDILYDHRVKLIATAACSPELLYTAGTQAGEFSRTVSRLTEMQSHDYLALPHLS